MLTRTVTAPAVPDPLLVQNSYDEARVGFFKVGQLTTLHNGAATHVMDWRASGNLARRATPLGGKTTTRTDFEDAGQKPIHATWEGDGSGTKLEVGTTASRWTYTGNGLLKTVPGTITDTEYEADGQTRSIAYANGVTTAFTCSPPRRWLTGFETKQANGTVLLAGTYTRDDAGRITVIDGPAPADDWVYTYDHLDQLLMADSAGDNTLGETFVYSTTGNLTSRTRLGQAPAGRGAPLPAAAPRRSRPGLMPPAFGLAGDARDRPLTLSFHHRSTPACAGAAGCCADRHRRRWRHGSGRAAHQAGGRRDRGLALLVSRWIIGRTDRRRQTCEHLP